MSAPTTAWRISNYADLSGYGGILVDGRWHSKGRPIVYCALTPAGALLEHLVHLDIDDLPATYKLIGVEIDAETRIQEADAGQFNLHEIETTRAVGDRWLRAGESLGLRVPSAIMPHAFNLLISPAHADIGKAKIVSTEQIAYDRRLLGR